MYDLTLVLFVDPLHVGTQSIKCAPGLPLGHATDERAADYRPHGAEWRTELVAIVKSSTTIVRLQGVFAACMRARRTATLPYGQLAGAAVDELPVNLEADPSHMDLLVHPVADTRRPRVGMKQLAVNGDPFLQRSGIHDRLPHIGGRGW